MFQNLFQNVMTFLTPLNKYQINDYNITEEQLLSEGGYAYVYRVAETNNPQQKYALKKMVIQINFKDNETLKATKKEVELWMKLGKHPHIVKYISSQIIKGQDDTQQMLILCELCEGGTLIDTIERSNFRLQESQIISIMKDVVKGVKYMHEKGIAHRDLKVENILFQEGKYKLADFGSASTQMIYYQNCTKSEISKAMEKFEKYTTLMYRPPEMIDQYLQYNVDLKADIWMLGCILYSLCFARQPFQDAQKLAIINAHYFMSNDPNYDHITEKMKDLIILLLTPNPDKRPTICQLEILIDNYNQLTEIQLSDDALEIKKKQLLNNPNKQKSQPNKNQVQNNKQQQQNWNAFGNHNESDKQDQSWDGNWQQSTQNNTNHNPFDNVEFQFDENRDNVQPMKNPFEFQGQDSQESLETNQQNWFFNNDKQEETINENQKSWTDFNFTTSNKEESEVDDDDEEQPNMFRQINQAQRKRKSNGKRQIAKSWCSNLAQKQGNPSNKNNICTLTTDLITKFRQFLQKS